MGNMSALVAFEQNKAPVDLDAFDRKVANKPAVSGAVDGELLRFNGKAGHWSYGRDNIEPEDGAVFAVNIYSARHGYRVWVDKKPHDLFVSAVDEMPEKPDTPVAVRGKKDNWGNFIDWKPAAGVDMVCVSGEDAGVKLVWTQDSGGAVTAIDILIREYGARPQAAFRTPLVRLKFTEDKATAGLYYPRLEIVGWGNDQRQVISEDRAVLALGAPAETSEAGKGGSDAPASEADAPLTRRRRNAA